MTKRLRSGGARLAERIRDSRLKTKLTLLVLLAVFIPLIVSTALFISFSAENLAREQQRNAQNAWSQTLDLFVTRVDVVRQDLSLLLQDTNVHTLLQTPIDTGDSQKLSRSKALMNNTFDYLIRNTAWDMTIRVFVPEERAILIDNRRIFPEEPVRDMAWYQKLVNEPYKKSWVVNGPETAALTDSPISCVARVCDPNSLLSTLAVIRFDFSRQSILQNLEQSLTGSESGAFLTTSDGEVILAASNLRDESLVRSFGNIPVQQFGQWLDDRGESGRYRLRMEIVPGTPWRLAYAYRAPEFSRMLFSNAQWLVMILISLAMGLAAAILALAFTRRITRQIAQVSEGMTALKDGELKPLARDGSHDEIGMLIESYNYLSDELVMLKSAQQMSAENQKHAEMVALQAQINPHFLYNTLEMINYFAMVGDAKQVERIVLLLSRFYKRCLNHGSEYATVREELELTRFYCEIQSIRHEGRIRFVFDVPEEAMECQVPHLLLQPLVENAIHHGIVKKPDQKGTITILGERKEHTLELAVRDEGVGMTPERLRQLCEELEAPRANEESGSHYALRNINARLVHLYGPAAGLSYESEEAQGATIRITLPLAEPEEP